MSVKIVVSNLLIYWIQNWQNLLQTEARERKTKINTSPSHQTFCDFNDPLPLNAFHQRSRKIENEFYGQHLSLEVEDSFSDVSDIDTELNSQETAVFKTVLSKRSEYAKPPGVLNHIARLIALRLSKGALSTVSRAINGVAGFEKSSRVNVSLEGIITGEHNMRVSHRLNDAANERRFRELLNVLVASRIVIYMLQVI